MSRSKNKSIPLIIGLGILIVVPLSIGIAISTALQGDEESQPGEIANPNAEQDPFSDLESEQGIKVSPVPSTESRGGAPAIEQPTEGIPTGTYSNPPASIGSSGSNLPSSTSVPLDDSGSSVENNQLIQENINSNTNTDTLTDYSSPSSSNNFNRTQDNSLVDPLEDDSFLDVPEADSDPNDTTIAPATEPLF